MRQKHLAVKKSTSKILGSLALCIAFGAYVSSVAASSRWGKGYLPNATLVTQDNKPVRFYDDVLKDKITVISFIYTSCREICPLITARLAQVYDQLGTAAGRDIYFVSISIDPTNDTPARLKEHADAFRSDPNWVFLTGDSATVRLVRHKLGERSRRLTEHAAQVMLYNDRTGEWSRDSAFADLGALTMAIRSMDPSWRAPDSPHAATVTAPGALPAEELPGQALFIKACASCHTIGQGDRVGPDIKDVASRRDKAWLQQFIKSPARFHAEKDPVALVLAERFPRVRMPSLQLSDGDVADLISYVDARSFAAAADARGHQHDHATAHSGQTVQNGKPTDSAAVKQPRSDQKSKLSNSSHRKGQRAEQHQHK